ncbi:hypothetical protein BJ742DRAFT_682219, partial [Cladochytrium replicatum]
GVSRLARFNTTAEKNKDSTGKVRFFEGTPIPLNVLVAMIIQFCMSVDRFGEDRLPGGKWPIGGWTFHPFSLLYALSGTAQISRIRIPKQ